MKLLIANFWDPEDTKHFGKYADMIDILVRSLKEAKLFFVGINKNAEEPLKEKVHGLERVIDYAKTDGFDRLLVLGEGVVLTPIEFRKMVEVDSDVVLTKKEDFSCCLVKVKILKVHPFAYLGELNPPDKMWLKILKQNGIKLSVINGVKPVYLNEL